MFMSRDDSLQLERNVETAGRDRIKERSGIQIHRVKSFLLFCSHAVLPRTMGDTNSERRKAGRGVIGFSKVTLMKTERARASELDATAPASTPARAFPFLQSLTLRS